MRYGYEHLSDGSRKRLGEIHAKLERARLYYKHEPHWRAGVRSPRPVSHKMVKNTKRDFRVFHILRTHCIVFAKRDRVRFGYFTPYYNRFYLHSPAWWYNVDGWTAV